MDKRFRVITVVYIEQKNEGCDIWLERIAFIAGIEYKNIIRWLLAEIISFFGFPPPLSTHTHTNWNSDFVSFVSKIIPLQSESWTTARFLHPESMLCNTERLTNLHEVLEQISSFFANVDFLQIDFIQECIPVGCLPAERWPYSGVWSRGGGVSLKKAEIKKKKIGESPLNTPLNPGVKILPWPKLRFGR